MKAWFVGAPELFDGGNLVVASERDEKASVEFLVEDAITTGEGGEDLDFLLEGAALMAIVKFAGGALAAEALVLGVKELYQRSRKRELKAAEVAIQFQNGDVLRIDLGELVAKDEEVKKRLIERAQAMIKAAE